MDNDIAIRGRDIMADIRANRQLPTNGTQQASPPSMGTMGGVWAISRPAFQKAEVPGGAAGCFMGGESTTQWWEASCQAPSPSF